MSAMGEQNQTNDLYRDTANRLMALEELYVRAMLKRWQSEWGEPHLVFRTPLHPIKVSEHGKIKIESDLVALGTPTDTGGIIVRVTIEDVREQVQ